ncbi:zinc finger protein 252-like isoform X2 [Protopterus annectens]|uniref:zinc finger protein 252-like isoform X2 n=1 Tax=Protopterus annectens TaxID=7888 RepID=UPI001CFB9C98|nr:zinc finger protein 252-like isoform X2 [Protopterus annectens]
MKVPQRRKKKETTSAKQSSDLAQDDDIAEGHTPTKKRKKWQPKAKAAPSTLSVSIKPSEQSSKEEKTEKKTKNKTSKVNMKVLKKRGLNGKTHLRVSDKLADKQKKPREKIKPQQLNCKADIRFSLLNQNVHELPLEKKDEDKKEIENPENEKPEGSKNILSKEKKEDELENTDPENVGESESGGTEQLKNLTAFDSNLFDITERPCELLSEKNKYEEKEGQKDENSKEAQPKEKDMNMGGNEPSPEEKVRPEQLKNNSAPVMLPGLLELNGLPSEEEEEEEKDEKRMSSNSKMILKKTGQDAQTQVNGSESMIKEQHRPEEAEHDEMNYKSTPVMLPGFLELNELPSEEEEEEDGKDENRTSSSSKVVLKKTGQDVQTQVNGSESMIKEQHRPEEAERDEMNCKSTSVMLPVFTEPNERPSEEEEEEEDGKDENRTSSSSKMVLKKTGQDVQTQVNGSESMIKEQHRPEEEAERDEMNCKSDFEVCFITQHPCEPSSEKKNKDEKNDDKSSEDSKNIISENGKEDTLQYTVREIVKKDEIKLQKRLEVVQPNNTSDSKPLPVTQQLCDLPSENNQMEEHQESIPSGSNKKALSPSDINEDMLHFIVTQHLEEEPRLQESLGTVHVKNKTDISEQSSEEKNEKSECTTTVLNKNANDDKTRVKKLDKAVKEQKKSKKADRQQLNCKANSRRFTINQHPHELPCVKREERNQNKISEDSKNELPKEHESLQYSMSGNVGKDVPDLQENVETQQSTNKVASTTISTCAHTSDKPMEEKKEDQSEGTTNMFSKDEDDKTQFSKSDKAGYKRKRPKEKPEVEQWKSNAAPDNLPKFLHSSDQPAEEKKVGRNSEGNIKVSTERQENRSTQVSISNKTTGKQQRLKKKAKMQQLQYTPNPKHFPIKKHPPKPPSKKKKKEKKENKSESGKNLPSSLKREKEGKRQYTPLENEGRAVPRLHKKKRVEELGSSALNRSSVYIEQRSKKPSYGNCHSSLPKEKRLLSEFGKNNHELPLVSSQHSHKDKRQYKCLECNKSFIAEKQLTIHQQNHIRVQKHSDFKKGFSKMHKLIIKQWTHKWEKPYKCTKCSKVFSQEDHLLAHQKGHMRKKSHKCMQCDKRFARKEYLLNHQKVHTGEKPHTCPECNKKFAHKHNLLSHQRVHTGQKPYKCTVCNKKFAHQQNMKKHMLVHTGQKPYKCTECGKSFAQKQNLTRHQRNHTGQKPYKCSDCNKLFSHKQTLMVHQRLHTGQKPYKCAECNKNFAHKQNLIRHQRIHSGLKPYKCNECNKIFTQKPHLVAHQRVHTGQKPYKCAECNKTFAHKPSLISHQWIHMGQKPHKCNECNKYFTTHSNLLRHQQGHVR